MEQVIWLKRSSKMNICIRKDEVFINDIYVGKMNFLPFDKSQVEKNPTSCFYQIITRFIETFLEKSTIDYLLRKFNGYRPVIPELSEFWINGQKIFGDKNLVNKFLPIAQLLVVTVKFITDFKNQQDRMWLILQNLDQSGLGVERKINILTPELKKFVLFNKKQNKSLSADFSVIILPCFKAIIRDIMEVKK